MKYLEDEKLLKLTSELADVEIGRSRSIHGRIEAYTMKRAGTEKKYAYALGERYVADLENVESQLQDYKTFLQRHSSKFEQQKQKKASAKTTTTTTGGRKRSMSTGSPLESSAAASDQQQQSNKQRRRTSSFDDTTLSKKKQKNNKDNNAPGSILQKKPLGDFGEIGTRRLMTDLILTLNSSFPDYDFGSIKPSDFEKIGVNTAIKRVNERLAEVNTNKVSFLHDMWNAMDDTVGLADCEVYSYAPKTNDQDDDPLSFLTQTLIIDSSLDHSFNDHTDGTSAFFVGSGGDKSAAAATTTSATVLWTFNYFFVNKTKKRIVFFTCVECMSRSCGVGEGYYSNLIDDDDEALEFVQYQGTNEASEVDFDLDPSAGVAGGIPIDVPISIM